MLTIKRISAYKIITRALNYKARSLTAILLSGADDCKLFDDEHRLMHFLNQNPGAIIVYNQHIDAINLVNRLSLGSEQILIEIRQDTKGVLGLHATRYNNRNRETLELVYQ